RKLPDQAGLDEVMAAAVLTSLSSSPLVLGPLPGAPSAGKAPRSRYRCRCRWRRADPPLAEAWPEAPAMSSSCSSSSNTSGEWSWEAASDRSSPSTPDEGGGGAGSGAGFLMPCVQNSTKVMFKCLWKSCGKVLSSSSGMQKHIRTAHLGRKADVEQSDGEEDFYYTELDVNVDSLTDGLSSLTPVSPTSSVPPAFPVLEAPPGPVAPPAAPEPAPLSRSAPSALCHVHTDHAYQVSARTMRPMGAHAPCCRKVYGMENRELWCTACRWKKACQRFVD
ncbi:S2A4R regulator, partial [Nothoprocta ornata]|nr:S2A4R regulator [Nothoprocta ornata]